MATPPWEEFGGKTEVPPWEEFGDAAPIKPRVRGYGEQFGRDVGLTARALLEPFGAEGALDMMGVPAPENNIEALRGKVAGTAMAAIPFTAGARTLATGATGTTKAILEILGQNPKIQAALAGISGGASELTKQAGGGELAQFGAAIGAPVASVMGGKMVAPLATKLWNIFAPVSKAGGLQAAGRVATDVGGVKSPAIAAEIANGAPPETAAQAAMPAGSAEFAGLERLVGTRRPSDFGPTGTIPRQAQDWMLGQKKMLNDVADPIRTQLLAQADNVGLNVAPISMEVANLKNIPGFKDETSRSVLNWVDNEIVKRADPQTGEIAALDLYGLRKDLGLHIQSLVKDPARKWNKKMAGDLLSRFQKSIDYEIEKASGNTSWTDDYMQPFAQRMDEINTVGDRVKETAKMGAAGSAQAGRVAKIDEAPVALPNMLNRSMMLLNAVLRRVQGYGGENTTKILADLMRPENKAQLSGLMNEELRRRGSRIPMLQAMGQAGRTGAIAGESAQ